MDERLSREKHIDSICSKLCAGIGAMRRVKFTFCATADSEMLYNAVIYNLISFIVAINTKLSQRWLNVVFTLSRDLTLIQRSHQLSFLLKSPRRCINVG